MFTNAILGLMTGQQTFFIDRLSQLIVRESSNFEWTSDDADLSDKNRDSKINDHAKRMTTSTNVVDKRLLNIFVMKLAHQEGLKFGFKNDVEDPKSKKKFSLHKTSKVFVEEFKKDGTIWVKDEKDLGRAKALPKMQKSLKITEDKRLTDYISSHNKVSPLPQSTRSESIQDIFQVSAPKPTIMLGNIRKVSEYMEARDVT